MSNRSYLYSTNFVPGTNSEDRRAVGICEWAYDLPIGFKLLVSGNPKACKSLIFDSSDEIAVIADFDAGVAAALRFLDCVPHRAVAETRDEAARFLNLPANKNPYFVLECGEVFAMSAESIVDENRKLLAELQDLRPAMAAAIDNIKARLHEETHPPGFVTRLLGARTPVRRERSGDLVGQLGLSGWENLLFFDPKLE